jgi:beta-xylosidase
LRRQGSYEEEFEVHLDFEPKGNLTEAGATVFYDDYLHNEIAIVADDNGGRRILTKTAIPNVPKDGYPLQPTNYTVTTVT